MSASCGEVEVVEEVDLFKELREMDAMLKHLKRGAKQLLDDAGHPESEQKRGSIRDQMADKRRQSASSSWARSTTKKELAVPNQRTQNSDLNAINPGRGEQYVRTRTPQYSFGIKPPLPEDRRKGDTYYSGDYDYKVDYLSTRKRARVSTISKTSRLDPFGYEHGRVVPHVHVPAGDTALRGTSKTADCTSAGTDTHGEGGNVESGGGGGGNVTAMEGDVTANTNSDTVIAAEGGTAEVKGPVKMDIEELDNETNSTTTHEPHAPKHPDVHSGPISGRSYSFGKDRRFPEHASQGTAGAGTSPVNAAVAGNTPAVLDVESAARALQPHTTTAVMGPRPTPKPAPAAAADQTTSPDTGREVGKIDVLSYRPRTPNITMRPSTPFDKTKITGDVDLGAPGPGYYHLNHDAVTSKSQKSHSKPVGVVYHTHAEPKKPLALAAKVHSETEAKSAIGPGSYAVDKSFAYVAHRQPVLAVMRAAESKGTPQMQRKRYFEQKAADMREVHDHLRETDITLVTTRTPVVTLAPPQWTSDPKRLRILQEHRINQMRPSSATTRSSRVKIGDVVLGRSFDDLDADLRRSGGSSLAGSEDKKFRGVEKRVKTGAFMRAEVAARRSTSAMRQARPGVMARLVEDRVGPAAARRFYGPQVPVPWAPDEGAASDTQRSRRRRYGGGSDGSGSDADSGADSPSEEVRQLLAARGNPAYVDADAADTEYTAAYLKSRYSGSLVPKKPAVLMTAPRPGDSRNPITTKLTLEQQEREFLGPQLQSDWLAEGEKRGLSHKNQSLRMDKVPGRERVKIHAKGVVEKINFSDLPAQDDPMGPGYYDTAAELTMAAAAERPLGLPFGKAIARKDQVGAFGERPESAVEVVVTDEGEFGDLYFEGGLELDAAEAKDKHIEHRKSKAPLLYVKDRHEPPKPKVDDHLGGTWFEGMAQEALKRPAAVDFDRMTGRPAANDDAAAEEALQEMVGPLEGQIDLEVQDWHPNKPKPAAGYVMKDPKKHPRFPKEPAPAPVDPDAPLQPLPNYDYLKAKDPVLVNMSKMRGRVDEDSDLEEAILREMEGEQPDFQGAQEVAAERDRQIRHGAAALSNYKRTPQTVAMDKQVGRADNAPQDSEQLLADLNHEPTARLVDNPDLYAPVLRNPKDIGRGDGGSARDWSKLPGREQEGRAAEDAVLAGEGLQGEELILDPVRDGTSKHKRVKGGAAWEKGAENPRFVQDGGRRVDGNGDIIYHEDQLDLDDVDPGKFKAGMRGLNDLPSGGITMANQLGRPNNPRDAAALKAVGLQQEELILEPGENPRSKRVPAATFARKGDVAGIEDTYAGEKAQRELRLDEEQLITDPTRAEKYLQKNIQGGVAMKNKAAQSTRKEEAVDAEIRNSAEVLKLEPTAADKLVRKNPVLATSMSGRATLRESRHEAAIEAENRKSAATLDIEPTDAASRFRVTGGTTMGNKSTRMTTANEDRAIADHHRASAEELIVDPQIQATRVSIPNASALGNKETRIRSSVEDKLLLAEQRASQEELKLHPELATANRRRVPGTNTLSNTAERFPTLKETVVEETLKREVDPEVLILEPTDAKIKKSTSASGFPKSNTGRGQVVKEPEPTAATAKAATVSNSGKTGNGSGKLKSTAGTASSAASSTQKSGTAAAAGGVGSVGAGAGSSAGTSGKRSAAAGISGKATTTTTASAANKSATSGSSKVAGKPATTTKATAAPPTEEPGTPIVRVPELSAVAPRAPRNKAVYDNLSPNEMMDMIDMQNKVQGLKL